MSNSSIRKDPYLLAEKYGYVEGENGVAFLGFGFPQNVMFPPTDRFFVGLGLDEIEELAAILQDHVHRNRSA